jgi:hypothetical protein
VRLQRTPGPSRRAPGTRSEASARSVGADAPERRALDYVEKVLTEPTYSESRGPGCPVCLNAAATRGEVPENG